MPLRYRHGYAAVLPRGLPAGDLDRHGSFQHHSGASAHRNPAPIRQVRAGGSLEGGGDLDGISGATLSVGGMLHELAAVGTWLDETDFLEGLQ